MKRSIWLVVVVVVAACGSKPKFPSDDRADREVIDCPTGPALDRAADAAWDTARLGKDAEHAVTCTPLYNHEPLWLLDGTVTTEGEVVVGTALTTTKNEPRWKQTESVTPAELELRIHDSFTAVDLDGDAHDEVVAVDGKFLDDEQTEMWLTPYAIDDGKLVAGPQLPLSRSAEGCLAAYEIITAPRGRHLIKVDGGTACTPPGVHTYGWQVNQLVEE